MSFIDLPRLGSRRGDLLTAAPACRSRAGAVAAGMARLSSIILGGLAFAAIIAGIVALRAAVWVPDLWR